MSPAQSWSVSPQKILYSYCILLYVNKHFIFLYIIILVYDPHEGCDLVIITTSHPRGEGCIENLESRTKGCLPNYHLPSLHLSDFYEIFFFYNHLHVLLIKTTFLHK